MDNSGDGTAEENVFIANGVPADDGAVCLFHFVEATANDFTKDGGVALFGKADNRESGDGFAAHGVNVAEGIGRSDLAEREWIVDDGREKIDGLNNRKVVGELI